MRQKNLLLNRIPGGLWLMFMLTGCFLADPGRIRLNYPQDLDYVSGYFGDESVWGNWGIQQLELVDHYAVLASPELVILDIADPDAIRRVGWHDTTWQNVDDMVVHNNRVYLASKSHGLEIFDISDPTNPVRIGAYAHQNDRRTSIAVSGDYVYYYAPQPYTKPFAQRGWERNKPRWLILDVSDPESVQMVREIADLAKPMALASHYIYAAGDWSEGQNRPGAKFQIIDITDRADPIVISELVLAYESIFDIVVVDEIVYVSVGTGIYIIDVSNPHSPKILMENPGVIGSFANIDVEDDILKGDFLWSLKVNTVGGGVDIQPLAELDWNRLSELFCDRDSSPALGSDQLKNALCPTDFRNEGANDIALKDGLVYVATDETGLLIFRVPQ